MRVPNIQVRDMNDMNSTTQQNYPKKKKKKVTNNVPVKKK
jgi:hypothetical protein